jgi:hypothetical protein
MTSTNPCAVYNFYNCCHDDASSSAGGTSKSALFIWQSGNILDPSGMTAESLTLSVGMGNSPNAALKSSLGLLPLHKKAQLQEISLLRLPDQASGPAYAGTVKFDLVVMDYAGALIRKISTTTLDYKLIPLKVWTPIALSTATGDLDVMPGEVIAGQLTFGTALPSGTNYSPMYQLSGTGVLMP